MVTTFDTFKSDLTDLFSLYLNNSRNTSKISNDIITITLKGNKPGVSTVGNVKNDAIFNI